jgi:camelysin-like metallo-endopeptidase
MDGFRPRRLALAALAALLIVGIATDADRSAASFTATTTSPGNQFTTATLSLSNDKAAAASLISIGNLVPGDTAARTVTITNTGNVGFTYVGAASATASTVLWTDTVNGLQVTVTRGATTLYTGALKNLALPASGTIAAAGTDTLAFSFSLPSSAGNTFQSLTQDFTITYTATQLAGAAR